MKLGVHRADAHVRAWPSPATRLHLRHIRAFGVPCAGDEHGPYVRFTLCEVDPIARQPSARTEALSHADQCDPVWHDDLRLMLAAGTVRPPLVRVEVRQRVRRSAGWQALAKTLPSSGPTLWSDRAAASASCSDSGEAAQQADALSERRRCAWLTSQVVELQLAGEGKSSFLSFAYEMRRAPPRRLTLRSIVGFGVPEARLVHGSNRRQQSPRLQPRPTLTLAGWPSPNPSPSPNPALTLTPA